MAQYYNLKNILDDLKEAQRKHKQINSWGTGDISQLIYLTQDNDKAENTTWAAPIYPLMYCIPGTIQRNENYVVYTMNVIITDQMNAKNYANEAELLSDTAQMLSDVLAQFKYSVTALQGNYYSKYDIVLPSTLTPFTERYDGILVGWNGVLQIEVEDPLNRCLAPFEPFEARCKVFITNSTDETIVPNGSWDRLYWVDDTGGAYYSTPQIIKYSGAPNTNNAFYGYNDGTNYWILCSDSIQWFIVKSSGDWVDGYGGAIEDSNYATGNSNTQTDGEYVYPVPGNFGTTTTFDLSYPDECP